MNIKLFAYLDIRNPMVAWEVAIGRVRSVSDVTREEFGVSIWTYSLLREYAAKGSDKKFLNELLLERVRLSAHVSQCSRLSDLYFFESEYAAHAALERWNIRGCRDFISQVNFSANRLTKVDSEWITSYLLSDERGWMNRYWSGETLGVKPLTEVLASGIGFVKNEDLRRRAYQSIIDRWPTATPLLSMACCAFADQRLEDVAIVRPAIFEEDGKVQGSYFLDIRDLDINQDKVLAALSACNMRNEFPPTIVADDNVTFFTLPDMSEMSFVLTDSVIAAELGQVHSAAVNLTTSEATRKVDW